MFAFHVSRALDSVPSTIMTETHTQTENYSKPDSSQIKRWKEVKDWGATEVDSEEQVDAEDTGSPCHKGSAAGPA